MTVLRLFASDGQEPQEGLPEEVPLDDWLAYLETRRDAILMELRQIEPALIKYGRLRAETPRRKR